MTTRTSKHFLYNWLKEDAFAEYTLRKSYTVKLTKLILRKVWSSLSQNRNLRRNLIRVRVHDWRQLIKLTNRYFLLNRRLNSYKQAPLRGLRKRTKFQWKKNQKVPASIKLAQSPSTVKLKRHSFIRQMQKRKKPSRHFSVKQLNKKMFLYSNNMFVINNLNAPFLRKKRMFYTWGKKIGRLRFNNFKHLRLLRLGGKNIRKRRLRRTQQLPKLQLYETKRVLDVLRVPRHEIKTLKNVHALLFYNIQGPYKYLITTSRTKQLEVRRSGSFIGSCELKLSSALLRAGFFENAYIVDNLAKRLPFLINGTPVNGGHTSLRCWDYVTMDKRIWWYVYARLWSYSYRWVCRVRKLRPTRQRQVRRFIWLIRKIQHKYYRNLDKKRPLLYMDPSKKTSLSAEQFSTSLLGQHSRNPTLRKKNKQNYLKFKKFNFTRAKKNQPKYKLKKLNQFKKASKGGAVKQNKSKNPIHFFFKTYLAYSSIGFTKTYLRLKKNLILESLTTKTKKQSRFYYALKHFKNVYKLVQRSKFSNKFNIIVATPPHIEISYKLLAFVIYRLPRKSTDSNLPGSVKLINRLNRLKGTFKPVSKMYLMNKNRFN